MTTFDDLAPHPSPGQHGAALRLAKSYAVLAQANLVRSLDGPIPDTRTQGALSFQHLYTIVHLVAGLIEEAGDARADALVSNLLLDLEAPHVMGPDLHAWLTENGIDPAQVDRITRALPEMQRPKVEPEPDPADPRQIAVEVMLHHAREINDVRDFLPDHLREIGLVAGEEAYEQLVDTVAELAETADITIGWQEAGR